jgi:sugar phosphate isomerase/epimerase
MPKPISVQLYSLREDAAKDFPAVLKKVAAMGYIGVEFAGLHGMKAADVARILKDLGLKASSAHTPMPSRENIGRLAADAAELGYSRLISGFGPDHVKTIEGVRKCAAQCAEACELAYSAGIFFGLHNHWWEFDHAFDGQTPYDILMGEAPCVYSELDIYWSTRGGADTTQVLKRWSRRVPLLHVKDGDLGKDDPHKAVGRGRVPVRAIVEAADPCVLEWLVVELDHCATDMTAAVAESCRFLVQNGLAAGRK